MDKHLIQGGRGGGGSRQASSCYGNWMELSARAMSQLGLIRSLNFPKEKKKLKKNNKNKNKRNKRPHICNQLKASIHTLLIRIIQGKKRKKFLKIFMLHL